MKVLKWELTLEKIFAFEIKFSSREKEVEDEFLNGINILLYCTKRKVY
jgi:hypothetical protein